MSASFLGFQRRLVYIVFFVGIGLQYVATAQRGPICNCRGGCGREGLKSQDRRKENVAYGKPANISSQYSDADGEAGPGCVAVNGRTSTTYRTLSERYPNCVNSGSRDYWARWQVDLGDSYFVESITIYRRRRQMKRMALLTVEVDNVTCYHFNDSITGLPAEINFNCQQPLTGRYVTIRKRQTVNDDRKYINICEVQVWTCISGTYGEDCGRNCGHCRDDGVCNKGNGTCPNGCQPGFDPSDSRCETPCRDGTYGWNCASTCGQCRGDGVCNKGNGICPDGCQPGFHPSDSLCKTTCADGTYGKNCASVCGQCRGDGVCNKGNGACPYGCQPGLDPSDSRCKTYCAGGTYGENCASTCGQCRGDGVCNKKNGACPDGCQPGFDPNDSRCKTPCAGGRYGENCARTCGQCRGDGVCNKVNGTCPDGCQPGFDPTDSFCTQPCRDGTYGTNCASTCGQCRGYGLCNKGNGTCLYGCQPGFDPSDSLCKTLCADGNYGENCASTCGQCRGDGVCNKGNGTCPDGCQPGFDPSDLNCKRKHVEVYHDMTCGQTEMSFSISRANLKFVPQNVTLSDPRCHVDITASHLTGQTPLNECGTSLRLTNDSLVFSNFLLFPPTPAEDNNITSNIERIIPIECRYSRVSDLRLNYLPMVRQILFTETGVGQFQFRIDQFYDGSFTSKVADFAYPVKVTSSERVFLQLSLGQWALKGKDGYGMEVERCVASPSPSMMAIHNDSSDELIRDSCPVKPDVHWQLIDNQSEQAMQNASGLPQEFRFSFKPTIVPDASGSAKAPFMRLMYIHCRVRLCTEDACHSSAECAPPEPGNMKRRKRSVGEWGYSERRPVGHHLSTGPFLFAGDDAGAPRSSAAALTSPLVVAFAALAGTTTLIALGVIAAWTFSRRREERYEVNHVTIRQQ